MSAVTVWAWHTRTDGTIGDEAGRGTGYGGFSGVSGDTDELAEWTLRVRENGHAITTPAGTYSRSRSSWRHQDTAAMCEDRYRTTCADMAGYYENDTPDDTETRTAALVKMFVRELAADGRES